MTEATPPIATPIVYGIANCDTVKKARAWLQAQNVAYEWHDFKKQGVPIALLEQGLQQLGRDVLINRKGTTWRKLSPAEQAAADSREGAIALMQAQPSVIKRPVLEHQGRVHIGFSPERYSEIFA